VGSDGATGQRVLTIFCPFAKLLLLTSTDCYIEPIIRFMVITDIYFSEEEAYTALKDGASRFLLLQ